MDYYGRSRRNSYLLYTLPTQGKLLGVLFYEASTRTSCSFQAAMLRLGGGVVPLNVESSSAKKGESLEGLVTVLSRISFYHKEIGMIVACRPLY